MDLLRYEFIEGPDDSINGMLRALVKGLRYNRSYLTVEEFKKAMPSFYIIEASLQQFDEDISRPKRNYIQEIMEELDQEQDNEEKIYEDLKHATIATIRELFRQEFQFDELSFEFGKADQYHWLQLSGYTDKRTADANLVIVREVFRSIGYRYNYIFVDLS